MRELVKLKYHKLIAPYTVVEEIKQRTEYVILDLVTSFSDIEHTKVPIRELTGTQNSEYYIAPNVKHVLIQCSNDVYSLEKLDRYYSKIVSEVICYSFIIKFSDGIPLRLLYVDKNLAESEHSKLYQEYNLHNKSEAK